MHPFFKSPGVLSADCLSVSPRNRSRGGCANPPEVTSSNLSNFLLGALLEFLPQVFQEFFLGLLQNFVLDILPEFPTRNHLGVFCRHSPRVSRRKPSGVPYGIPSKLFLENFHEFLLRICQRFHLKILQEVLLGTLLEFFPEIFLECLLGYLQEFFQRIRQEFLKQFLVEILGIIARKDSWRNIKLNSYIQIVS